MRRALRRPESMNRVDLPHPPLLAYWAPPTCPPHPAGAMADGAGDAIARPVRLSSSARSRANESSRGLYPRPSLVKLAVRDLACVVHRFTLQRWKTQQETPDWRIFAISERRAALTKCLCSFFQQALHTPTAVRADKLGNNFGCFCLLADYDEP